MLRTHLQAGLNMKICHLRVQLCWRRTQVCSIPRVVPSTSVDQQRLGYGPLSKVAVSRPLAPAWWSGRILRDCRMLRIRLRIPLDEAEDALLLVAEQTKQMQVCSKPHAVALVSVSPQTPQYAPVLKGATSLALCHV